MFEAIVAIAFSLILSPCPTEDSTDCYWNASAEWQGNGQGRSFVDLDGIAYYLP